MTNFDQLIRYNFNQAAAQYLANAEIQRSAALKIINYLSKYYQNGMILDLGSGPGTLAHTNSQHDYPTIAFDLSLSMLKTATFRHRVNGDASNLPFAANSFSIIISNLMLQWSHDKKQIIDEIYRVLKPGGKLILTTLIKPSLNELQQAWRQVDHHSHTINFLASNTYSDLFINLGFKLHQTTTWQKKAYFSNLPALLHHFKATGTSLAKSTSNGGLGGKKQLQLLDIAYRKLAQNGLLPLTYAYLLLIVSKGE